MEIERLSALLAVLLPVLLVLEGVLAVALWRKNGWDAPHLETRTGEGRFGALRTDIQIAGVWLAVTALVLWVGFLVAFFVAYGILFTMGRAAALVAILASLALAVATPFVTGLAVRRWVHHR
jgi:uncharacterized Tic20 family protein